MAAPVYLLCGDDDTKVDAWRARLRARSAGALERFDAQTSDPADVATVLATPTLLSDERYVLVDGVECWKAAALEPLERALRTVDPGTTLVMVARGKPLARLTKAVAAAGGEQREYAAPKPWKLPEWAGERAREEGLQLDREGAKTLVALVGPSQQRLLREIEKLAIAAHPCTQLSADGVRELVAGSASEQAYDLADAVVAGDPAEGMRIAERLTVADERPSRLMFAIVRRLRDVHRVAELLDAGMPEGRVQSAIKMPPWAWKRTLAYARRADRDRLDRALCAFADLELELRGGGVGLDEETAFSLALSRAAA